MNKVYCVGFPFKKRSLKLNISPFISNLSSKVLDLLRLLYLFIFQVSFTNSVRYSLSQTST